MVSFVMTISNQGLVEGVMCKLVLTPNATFVKFLCVVPSNVLVERDMRHFHGCQKYGNASCQGGIVWDG